MNKVNIEEIVRQLKSNRAVCVCEPFCDHWEAHAVKVLSKYFPTPADPPHHDKNCAVWTVTRDGDKNTCDCGFETRQFQEHLEYASRLAATWQPWERHILSGTPCGVDDCPCQRGAVPCRCGSMAEVKYLSPVAGFGREQADDHLPNGSWVVHCLNNKCRQTCEGFTRNGAIEYWNSQQLG